ncbi:bifunctional lysylphosphatidylglycerol flippase/synthetase MprF [Cellulosimicrobium protaetiae]|uniref:DUF2156 domain-containing protein n=1 Tax=Cellulosimicrobium protaetiae TaxID=2587808 RepID=A0A6M5U8Y8_9MICO|nr:DUF2156 domain-containing protein [Cellulosimicrobium protaetiae]QJW34977.1 DUF2156 domain-containing protein [Cellulosimicrobium protaetiae]
MPDETPRPAAPESAPESQSPSASSGASRAASNELVATGRHSPLAAQRHRVRVRRAASTVVVALAVLSLVGVVARGLWTRLTLYQDVVPGVEAGSHTSSILLAAVVLFLTARGLRNGHRLAWLVTCVVLGITAVAHLLHHRHAVPAVVVLAAVVWLLTQWRAFPVLPNRRAVRRAVLLLVAAGVALVLVVVGVAVVLAARDAGDAELESTARVLAAVATVLNLLLVVLVLWWLLSPRSPRPATPAEHLAERERARAVVAAHGGGTLDYFALRDDKDWFFVGHGVVAHSVRNGVCLVSPDPVCPADERELVWAEFLDHVGRNGWKVAVVAAGEPWLPVYEASGLLPAYLGDEATVDCPSFSLEGKAHKSLRQAVNRVARAGYTTTFHDPTTLDPALRAEIAAMSDESRRGEDERGFSMTLSRLFDPHDTGLMLSVTRSAEGRVDAFCQWVPASDIGGWSLDVMRRRLDVPDLPNGLVDATIVATIAELVARGERGLGLNFAVLRELMEGERDSRLDQLVRPVVKKFSEGTQVETLATFNDKFDPGWTRRYVVLDSAEQAAVQALVMAGAEGVTEIPVIGRFLRGVGAAPAEAAPAAPTAEPTAPREEAS